MKEVETEKWRTDTQERTEKKYGEKIIAMKRSRSWM
jgi:hypothetical protein